MAVTGTCRQCHAAVAVDNRPLPHYEQLVITMRTPEGTLSTHEMLVCMPCRQTLLTAPMSAIVSLYVDDVADMVVAHTREKPMTPELQRYATYLMAHTPVALRNEIGTSVASLRQAGQL